MKSGCLADRISDQFPEFLVNPVVNVRRQEPEDRRHLRTPKGSLRERRSEVARGFTKLNRNESNIQRLASIHPIKPSKLQSLTPMDNH